MNKSFALFSLLLALSAGSTAIAQEEAPGELKVQAYSLSDPDLLLPEGNCAEVIKELQVYEKYKLTTAASLQGPPGVLFMLENPGKNVVLLKCGTGGHGGGCGEEDDGGNCEG